MLSVSIMAHPKRKELIPYLHEKVGYKCAVAWDDDNTIWNTSKKAWLQYDKKATHHLVLQDDALLCEDFIPGVAHLINIVPDKPISLFAMKRKSYIMNGKKITDIKYYIRECKEKNMRWLVLNKLNWGVSVLLPTKFIRPMISYVDKHCYFPQDDFRIAYYFLHKGIPIWHPIPSLVDHRTEGGSLVSPLYMGRDSQKGRCAEYFIGENVSALSVNWNIGCIAERELIDDYYAYMVSFNSKHKNRINS